MEIHWILLYAYIKHTFKISVSPLKVLFEKEVSVGMIYNAVLTAWASVFVSYQYLINKPQKASVYTIICREGGGRKQLLLLEDVEIVESFPLNMCWNTHIGSEFRSESLQFSWCLLRAVASSCRWALLPSSRQPQTLIQTCKCLCEARDV